MERDKLMSFAELRAILPISRTSAWRLARRGVLRPVKVLNRSFWRATDVLAFIEQLKPELAEKENEGN